MSKKSNTSHGNTLLGLVFIVFLVLKLAGIGAVATWSWWWMLAPLWVPAALMVVIVFVWVIGFVIREIFKK